MKRVVSAAARVGGGHALRRKFMGVFGAEEAVPWVGEQEFGGGVLLVKSVVA